MLQKIAAFLFLWYLILWKKIWEIFPKILR